MIKVTYLSQTADSAKMIQCDHLATITSKAGDFKLYLEGEVIFYGHLNRIIAIEAGNTHFKEMYEHNPFYEEYLQDRAEGQGD